MTVTPADFRTAFPEFANDTTYPDATVEMWLTFGVQMVNADRWGVMTDLGVQLWAAHNIVLQKQATASASAGKVPGVTTGLVAEKRVGKVSIGYDVFVAASEQGAGSYNLTSYGQRYWQFAMMFGAGGIQL